MHVMIVEIAAITKKIHQAVAKSPIYLPRLPPATSSTISPYRSEGLGIQYLFKSKGDSYENKSLYKELY